MILISAFVVLPEAAALADAIIPKPFAPERLVEVVGKLTGRRQADRTEEP